MWYVFVHTIVEWSFDSVANYRSESLGSMELAHFWIRLDAQMHNYSPEN